MSTVAGGSGLAVVSTKPTTVPPDAVTSVFGRTGAVVAVLGDYTSSLITNVSGVAGATVTAALNALATLVAACAPARLTVTAVNASRDLLASDNNSLLVCDSGSAIVLTVNGGVMSAGDVVPIAHKGAGAVSVAAGSGGMVITSRGGLLSTGGTGAYCSLVFESSTLAYFAGDRA